MIFKENEIEELEKAEIYIDKREYSTDELCAIINKTNRKTIGDELYDKLWNNVFGSPASKEAVAQGEINSPEIKKEDIIECPRCKSKLRIMKDDVEEECYKCEKCKYVSYIIIQAKKEETLKVNDKVKLKGQKDEGTIIEIINDNECMVEFDEIKKMKKELIGTAFFDFLEKIQKGEVESTHVEKRNIEELEKIQEEPEE